MYPGVVYCNLHHRLLFLLRPQVTGFSYLDSYLGVFIWLCFRSTGATIGIMNHKSGIIYVLTTVISSGVTVAVMSALVNYAGPGALLCAVTVTLVALYVVGATSE